jgi:formate-dependent nitrite reductase cytochrome c552 subunit
LGGWGVDHVGGQLPLYMTGDECLFCHREVGENWQANWHNTGMRNVNALPDDVKSAFESPQAAGFAPEATYTLGGRRLVRFLKPNERYGQFAMHAASWNPHTNEFVNAGGDWDPEIFAANCAGCHTTAVETEIHAFAAPSLDCFVCHGDTPPGHQNEPAQALFAKSSTMDPRVEMSICGSCHLRGGSSRSTALPYPNQFVPGDNLFKDFKVNLAADANAGMNPGDAHIFVNAREVLIEGKTGLTCVTCHDIHGESSRKHRVLRRLERAEYCAICHDKGEDYTSFIKYEAHNALCRY